MNQPSTFRTTAAALLFSLYALVAYAQPSTFYTDATMNVSNGFTVVNSRLAQADRGSYRQVIFQSTSVQASKKWAWHNGTQATPDYTTNWRPYLVGSTALTANAIAAPNGGGNFGALYNTGSGGQDGNLPSLAAAYYTFNLVENGSVDSYMSMWETSFAPSQLTGATHTAAQGNLSSGTALNAGSGEAMMMRYSTDAYVNSTILKCNTNSNSSTTYFLPGFPGSSINASYYFYSTSRTKAAIDGDVTTHGQRAHDLSSFYLINNAAANYSTGALSLPVSVTGTTDGSGTLYYINLGAAFSAINNGVHTGVITINITGDVTESTTAVLNASGITVGASPASSYTAINITPTGGVARTITGAIAAGSPLIDLNGADNVTINGLNTGGNSLTISNTTASATSGTSTFRFIGDATNNTLTNCSIQGSPSMTMTTNGGIIFFSTSTTNGNDNNTISNCNIGPAGSNLPSKAIFGNGSTANTTRANSGIIISGNNIFDYYILATHSAIYTNDGNTDWTIQNNKFYQTASRSLTGTNSVIYINGSTVANNNNLISGNIIGFANSGGSGAYTVSLGNSTVFIPININAAGTTTATSIQGNTIAGITVSGSSSGTSSNAPFRGIYVGAGLTTIGDVTGNTIGSQSATGSITYTSSSTSASDVIGIYNFGSSNWTTNNNTIGGITASNSSTGASNIYGLRCNTGVSLTWSCLNNTVGGSITNSINSTSTASGTIVQGILNNSPIGTFTNNTIRNLTAAGGTGTTTSASVAGIVITTTANQTIGQNTIFNLNNSNTTAATVVTGLQMNGSTANLVERNLIYGLTVSTNSTSAEINGIRVAGGTTTYRNNMIALGANQATAIGTVASNTSTAGINGFNGVSGTNAFIHNSVYIGGTATSGTGNSYAINGTQTSGTRSFRNNIFFNARSNSGATGKHYAVKINGTTANPAGLTINNNVYFANGTGGVFGFFNSMDVANLAAWKTAVGQDANSFETNPQYNDPTNATPDLHLHPTNATVAEANGVDVGVTNDYAGQTRSGLTPVDIGADAGNFVGIDFAIPSITYTVLGNTTLTTNRTITVTITDVTGVATGGLAPRIYFNKNAGAYSSTALSLTSGSVTNGVWTATIDNALIGGVVATDVIRYFVVAQDVPGNLGANPSGGFTGTDVNTVTTPPTLPNSYAIVTAYTGIIPVGAAETFTSLTNTGGIFDAINNGVLTGNVTINLTSDLAAELGTVALNQWSEDGAGNYTLLIKPSGAPRTITGTNTGALIRFNGADRVTIDGSSNGASAAACLVGGNAALRELTIQNTNVGTSAVVISVGSNGTNGATNNTIRNVNILGQDPLTTLLGISLGGATPGTAATGQNNNNRVENCSFKRSIFGVFSSGVAATPTTGTVFMQNDISATGSDRVSRVGILVFNENGIQITENIVGGLSITTSHDAIGIGVGIQDITTISTSSGGVSNALVSHNKINGVASLSTTGFSAAGIAIAGATGGANIIQNNMITGVTAPATPDDLVAGIYVVGATGSDTRLYYNSISMTGDRGTVASQTPSYGIAITGTDPTVDLRNNIIYTTQIASGGGVNAKSYAIGMVSTTFVNLNSNYNDFWSTGANDGGFRTGSLSTAAGTDYAALAGWAAAVSDDANSVEADPNYANSLNDLHLNGSNDLGTPIAGITNDYDCQTRSASTPDIGADEFSSCTNVALTSATATTSPICSNATITLTYTGLTGTNASLIWTQNADGTGTQYGTSSITINGISSVSVGPGTYYAYATGDCGSPVSIAVTVVGQSPPPSAGSNGTLAICSSTTLTEALLFGALTGSPAGGGVWSPAPSGAGTYTYTQAAMSPCTVDNTATVMVTVNPIPSAPMITATNSTCQSGCTASGGSFSVSTDCGAGTTLTYYSDNSGSNPTTTPPTYNQTTPMTIYYACVDDVTGCRSAIQTLTTVPGTCTNPSSSTITATESTCMPGCTVSGGSFNITVCTGSTMTFYDDMVGTNPTTTAPTYNQTTPMTIFYACVDDVTGCRSAIQTLTTVPGTCAAPATPGTPTSDSPQCASPGVTITSSGSVPGGETWYWQGTNATGTSTANNATATYNATSSGTYYIRSQDNSTLCWSASASVVVTINPLSGTPILYSGLCPGSGSPIAGTSSEAAGTILKIYIDAVFETSTTVDAGGDWYTNVDLLIGESVTATATASGECESAPSAAEVVQPLATPPVITGMYCPGFSETITGTSVEADGSSVTIYVTGEIPRNTVVNSGAWSVSGVNLDEGDQIEAYVVAVGKCTSISSNVATVGIRSAVPGVNSPVCAGSSVVISGTSSEADGTIISLNIDGFPVVPSPVVMTGIWSTTQSVTEGLLIQARATAPGECISFFAPAVTVRAVSNAPVVTSPVCPGPTVTVSGTSSEANGTTITVYRNGAMVGTASVTGGNWSLPGVSLVGGDLVKATALATNKCVSSFSSTVTVNPGYTITATSGSNGTITPTGITTLCSGSNQSYTITPDPGYIISDLSVDGTPSTPLTTGSYDAGGTYNFTNVTANRTISATFVLACTPPTLPMAGSNSAVCVGNTLYLTSGATGSMPFTYSWLGPNGFTSAISNPEIPTVTLAAAGTYTVTVTNGCGSTNTSTTVIVVAQPNAGTSGSLVICAGSTVTLGQLNTAITGEDSGGAWTPALAGAGTYTYTVTANSPCTVNATSTVAVTEQAAPASAGSNGTLTICSSTTLTEALLFNALTGSPATGGVWTPTLAGEGTYTYTQAAIAPCIDNTATVMVFFNQTPSAPLIEATNSTCQSGCTVSGGSFTIATLCGAGTTLTYYSDNTGSNPTTTAPTYNQTTPMTIYYACVDDVTGCRSAIQTLTTVPGSCITPDAPTGSLAIINSTCIACVVSGGSITLNDLSANGGGTLEYSTDGGTNWSSTLPSYSGGLTILASVLNGSGCRSTTVSFGPTVAGTCVTPDAPTGSLTIVNSTCIACVVSGGSITLNDLSANGGGTLEYSTNGGTSWSFTLPSYSGGLTILASVLNGSGCRSTTVSFGPTVAGTCTTPAAPTGTLAITNSTCIACAVTGGSIAIGTVDGSGGTLEYSTNGGTTWSSTLPSYAAPQTIIASVLGANGCRSATTSVGSTVAGTCTTPAAPTGSLAITNSTCIACAVTGGSIAIGTLDGTAVYSQSVIVSGAGVPEINSTYTFYNIGSTGRPEYRVGGNSNQRIAFVLPANKWAMVYNDPAPGTGLRYCNNSQAMDVPITGWYACNEGNTPVPSSILLTPLPGGTIEYSTDGGANWSSTLPTYNAPQTILASVLGANGCRSTTTAVGTTVAGTCTTPAAPTGSLAITNSTCIACAVTGGSIAIGTVSGIGGTLEYSTDGGTTWSSTLPSYAAPQTIIASVLGANGCRSTTTSVGSTVAGTCVTPDAPTGSLNITNSTCIACTVTGGSIAIGTVSGSGGTLEYSTDGGSNWSPTLPTYNAPQTIIASVLGANGCRSNSTSVGSTVAGTCTTPDAPTGSLAITNSTCIACVVSGGSIAIGSVTGSGGTLEYSTDNGLTWGSLPTYSAPQTIIASVLGANGCRSNTTSVGSTVAGTCVTPDAPTGSLAIINGTCVACVVSGGSIAVGSVSGTGGTLEYSTNGGTNWSSTLPTYAAPQTILASVLGANGCRSVSFQVGTTFAGTCTIPSVPVITATNSTCQSGCTLSGGLFNTITGCGAGTTLTYYTSMAGTTTTGTPTYNQTTPLTIYYACVDDMTGCRSAIQTLTTLPGSCTTPATPSVNTTAATCNAEGTATITNYVMGQTYTFDPTGPSIGAGGLISGMTPTTNYTVTASNGSCTSVASGMFSIDAQLATPSAPTGNATQTFCQNVPNRVSHLTASGSNIKWYADASGGAPLNVNTNLVNGNHYHASQTVNGCESTDRFDVTVVLNPVPTIAIDPIQPHACNGSPSVSMIFTSTNSPDTYSIDFDPSADAVGFVDITNAPLGSSPLAIVIPVTATGSFSPYQGTVTVSNAVTGCGNPALTYNFYFYIDPDQTAGSMITGPTSLCIGATATYYPNAEFPVGGGTFSNSNPTLATIHPTTGELTALSDGIVSVIYTMSAGCGPVSSVSKNVTINPNNTASAGSGSPVVCVNTAITPITHTTTGATGRSNSMTGLPAGVTSSWSGNVLTISGTPSMTGTFNYNILLTGGCGTTYATGTIEVNPVNTAGIASAAPEICKNNALTPVTHTTTGATGIGVPSGLPTGVSAAWASDLITISGTPSVAGTFFYIIPLTGGCGSVDATGSITVYDTPTIMGNLNACVSGTSALTGSGTPHGSTPWTSSDTDVATINILGVVTAVSVGSTTITYTDINGCQATVAFTIIANTTPTVNISATPAGAVCSGTAVTFTATAGNTGGGSLTYNFKVNGGSVQSGASNTYTSSLLDNNDMVICEITVTGGQCITSTTAMSNVITIIVNANAFISSVSGTSPLCIGGTATYTANGVVLGGGTGAWSSDNTLVATVNPTTGVVSALTAGTANIIYTITGGCGSQVSSTKVLTVSPNVTAGTVSGTSPLCIGGTDTYSSDGTGGGTWSSNSANATVDTNTGEVTAVSAGAATITYTVNSGCGSPVSASKVLSISPNYTITASAGANGTVSPNGVTTLCEGNNQSYTITADPCYSIADVLVDGNSVGAVSNYAFSNVASNHTISATFVLNTYTIAATSGANGSVTPSGVTPVNCGDSQLYTITPNVGYHILDVLVNGVSNPTAITSGTYTFVNVMTNQTISASFEPNVTTIISGKIVWEHDDVTGVKDAVVSVTGAGVGSSTTDIGGNYSVTLPVGGNFTITPAKNINLWNGVDVADAMAIQQHVTGAPLITDPYKQIAADVFSDNSISTVDAFVIKQSMLGNPAALSAFTPSWRFTPATPALVLPPWGFAQNIELTTVSGIQDNNDFIGIKVGDVNGDSNPANKGLPNVRLITEDQELVKGQEISVSFKVNHFDDFAAHQLVLQFDPAYLQFITVDGNPVLPFSQGNFGTVNDAQGELRTVWAQTTNKSVADGTEVFTLHFKVLKEGALLSEVLNKNEQIFAAKAYTANFVSAGIDIEFTELTAVHEVNNENGLVLLQNKPNPFDGQTIIGFVLPKAGVATIRIHNSSGQLITQRKGLYNSGYQEEVFTFRDGSGVLYYELITDKGILKRKMIQIRR